MSGKAKTFDYTALAGLDAAEYEILLTDIDYHEVDGESCPVIPNTVGLHCAIVLWLLNDMESLRPSAYRFIRKTLGWTQTRESEELAVTVQTISYWENGVKLPKPLSEIGIRTTYCSSLLENSILAKHMNAEVVGEILRNLGAMVAAMRAPAARVSQVVAERGTMDAWMIHAIKSNGSARLHS